MTFQGTNPIRSKLLINDSVVEQVNNFNFSNCNIPYLKDGKIEHFNYHNGRIKKNQQ